MAVMLFKIKTLWGNKKEPQKPQLVVCKNPIELIKFFDDDPHRELKSFKILDKDLKEIKNEPSIETPVKN